LNLAKFHFAPSLPRQVKNPAASSGVLKVAIVGLMAATGDQREMKFRGDKGRSQMEFGNEDETKRSCDMRLIPRQARDDKTAGYFDLP
jgi:hypothetical protein